MAEAGWRFVRFTDRPVFLRLVKQWHIIRRRGNETRTLSSLFCSSKKLATDGQHLAAPRAASAGSPEHAVSAHLRGAGLGQKAQRSIASPF